MRFFGKIRQAVRFFAMTQLLPILESGEETTLVGGQAVLEGVMMRSPHAWGIAVRKPSGEVVTHSEPLEKSSEKHKWMGWPVLRGLATLGGAMRLGYRALKFSGNVAFEEIAEPDQNGKKAEVPGWVLTLNLLFSLAFFIAFYKFLPLLATTWIKRSAPALQHELLFNLVDGLIRIALFLLFIWGISLWADIKRVYRYHGAEHKTVFAFETGEPVNIARAQTFSTFHPRCGTSFLMTVMIIAMCVYALFPVHTFWAKFAIRIVMLPVIAGVSYELIRFAARKRNSLFALLTAPGLWLQRITTQPPSDDQVDCAIVALDKAMDLERARGGELVIA